MGLRRIDTLDGLRGVAAIFVLFWHYQHFYYPAAEVLPSAAALAQQPLHALLAPAYGYGWAGVQVFWAISGFVLGYVYLEGEPVGKADFAVRRVARLYPLHLATLILVAVLQATSLRAFGHYEIYGNNDAWHFLQHLVFASNWSPGAGFSFNGPIWSVSMEVLVYAVFVMLLPLLRSRPPLVWPLAAVCLALAVLIPDVLPLVCATFFFAGTGIRVLLAALRTRGQAMGLVAIGGAMALTGIATAGGSAWIEALAVGLVLVLGALDALFPLRSRALRWLGDVSYPIYLLHVPTQIVLLMAFDAGLLPRSIVGTAWFPMAWLALLLLLADCVHRGLEQPARAAIQRWWRGGTAHDPASGRTSRAR